MTVSPDPTRVHSPAAARVPDFFIVGHAKSGTTALYEMLRQHPQIYMPDHKEPWFFARSNPHPQTNGERSIAFTGKRMETTEEYLELFRDAKPDQIVGEASTSYLWSTTAARRIAQARPDARIIAIFREPASFLRSLHLQLLQNHHEVEPDFRRAVELDEPRRCGREIPFHSYWPQALIYSDRVRYVEQLRRYENVFPREQILVLIYDDFRGENHAIMRQVLRFLDVDGDHPLHAVDVNPTIAIRSARLDRLRQDLRAGRGPLLRGMRSVGKALTTNHLRRVVYYPGVRRAVWGKPPAADAAFMEELRVRFKPE